MKSFEYAAPGSVKAALELLGESWGKTEVLAGGTDLVTCLKQHLIAPERVVSLKNIPELKGIHESDDMVRVGALTSLGELASHPGIRSQFPALVTAAEGVGSPQLLNIGTVGGDLCQRPRCWYYRNGYGLFGEQDGTSLVREGDNRYHAIFANEGPALFVSASSLGPVLVALDATLVAEGPGGVVRRIPAADFFQIPKKEGERETAVKPNEILTSIEVPKKGFKNATYEVRHRQGLDWPYVTATVALLVQAGTVNDARVVLGQVAPVPWVAHKASATLKGFAVDGVLALQCGKAAVTGAKPLSQNGYKVPLVKTAVQRAVLAAAKA